MRAYIPVGWAELAAFDAAGRLEGPLRAARSTRRGAPAPLRSTRRSGSSRRSWRPPRPSRTSTVGSSWPWTCPTPSRPAQVRPFEDGWVTLAGPISRRDAAAVLTTDLAWFGVQEIPGLLER